MRRTHLCRVFSVGAVAAMSVLLFSFSSYAASYMKFCAQWTRTYTDAGYGEDYFTSSALNVQTGAYRARYAIRVGSMGSEPIQTGFLDGVGCMPTTITITPNTTYYFTQMTWAERDTRAAWVNTDTGTSFNNTVNALTSSYTTGASLTNGYTYTHTFSTVWASPKANLMPIIGHMLNTYYLYAMPSNFYTVFRTDIDACEFDGAYYSGSGHICVVENGNIYSWGDMTTWKFAIAHEFGHRIADATDGPYPDGYEEDTDTEEPDEKCTCDHIGGYGSDLHCLQSREKAVTAQGEGFAHFVATAAMNARVENDGRFVYPKPEFIYSGGWTTTGPPSPTNAYQVLPESNSDRWMEKYCPPGDISRGVELDWLRFYYEIWTTGTYKFSTQDIVDVWDDVTDDEFGWDNNAGSILPTVEAQWGAGTSKTNLFEDKGLQAGVDHG